MENEESQNQQSDAWNDASAEASAALMSGPTDAPPAPKDPNTTPTAELVADYEGLLEEIKGMKQGHDAAMAAYELRMKGASVEAAKLLVVISKRLGMPLNGAQPAMSKPTTDAVQKAGQANPSPCPYCGKEYMNGLGMHIAMHVRRGDKKGATAPRSHKAQTRWCDDCGKAIGVKGWIAHSEAHQRHGKDLSRSKVQSGRYGQAMGLEKIKSLLVMLRKAQPIKGTELSDQYYGGKNISAFLTGLKERGLAVNDEEHQWRVTDKGATYLKVNAA